MICCKVTGLSILVTADKQKEKTNNTLKTNKELQKKEVVQIDRQESQEERSLVSQLQDRNVSTAQSPCTERYIRLLLLTLLQYLGVSTGQHSSALLHREVSLCWACTYRYPCPRPCCDIIDSPLKTVGECPEGQTYVKITVQFRTCHLREQCQGVKMSEKRQIFNN